MLKRDILNQPARNSDGELKLSPKFLGARTEKVSAVLALPLGLLVLAFVLLILDNIVGIVLVLGAVAAAIRAYAVYSNTDKWYRANGKPAPADEDGDGHIIDSDHLT